MSMEVNVVKYHSHQGVIHALAFRGRKRMHLVHLNSAPISPTTVPLSEERYMRVTDYPVTKAFKHLRARARALGATKAAKRLLRIKR